MDNNNPLTGTPTRLANPQLNSKPAAATPRNLGEAFFNTFRSMDKALGSNQAFAAPETPITIKIKYKL